MFEDVGNLILKVFIEPAFFGIIYQLLSIALIQKSLVIRFGLGLLLLGGLELLFQHLAFGQGLLALLQRFIVDVFFGIIHPIEQV